MGFVSRLFCMNGGSLLKTRGLPTLAQSWAASG